MSDHDSGHNSGTTLKRTPLANLHEELAARMVPFAGYMMPVQYADGIIAEHNHTRSAASLFDVSHMGQVAIRGPEPAQAIERLVPGDIQSLRPGRVRYTQLTNDTGGIVDDLMVTNVGDYLFLVVNASRRDVDLACLQRGLDGYEIEELDRALFALQGPQASRVIARFAPGAEDLPFMAAAPFVVDGVPLAITRCGYTGEDGFEITVPAADAERLARALLAEQEVWPAGLGARDTLRLEAGLCLYGNDIDETTTPIEAGLLWTIARRRREEGGFPGATRILAQISDGPSRTLVGITPEGRAVARAPAEIRNEAGDTIGKVTSGGFGATIGGPVAMGYVDTAYAEPDTPLAVMVRGKPIAARLTTLPFVPHNYHKS
jgi:aminomethyltransferase